MLDLYNDISGRLGFGVNNHNNHNIHQVGYHQRTQPYHNHKTYHKQNNNYGSKQPPSYHKPVHKDKTNYYGNIESYPIKSFARYNSQNDYYDYRNPKYFKRPKEIYPKYHPSTNTIQHYIREYSKPHDQRNKRPLYYQTNNVYKNYLGKYRNHFYGVQNYFNKLRGNLKLPNPMKYLYQNEHKDSYNSIPPHEDSYSSYKGK